MKIPLAEAPRGSERVRPAGGPPSASRIGRRIEMVDAIREAA